MTAFLLVPGGWQGAWVYERTVRDLVQAGHQAESITLTGLDQNSEQPDSGVNLATHIEDVVRYIERKELNDLVLCAHSYAGIVITGAADIVPDRIAALVYIDAFVPASGDSIWTLTSEHFRRLFIKGARGDGIQVAVPRGIDPRSRPHPLATLIQTLQLTGAHEVTQRRTLIRATGWDLSPFRENHEQFVNDPSWQVHDIPSGHDVMAEAPAELLQILLEAAR